MVKVHAGEVNAGNRRAKKPELGGGRCSSTRKQAGEISVMPPSQGEARPAVMLKVTYQEEGGRGMADDMVAICISTTCRAHCN